MAKPRILKVVNYRQEDIPVLDELEKILKREGKEYTQFVRDKTVEYVKVHGNGNPTFQIDKWVDQPTLQAFPTLGENPKKYLETVDKKMCKELKDNLRVWLGEVGKRIPNCYCGAEFGELHNLKCRLYGKGKRYES